MRIIGGQFKGRKLNSFRGNAVRPTPDRVREAIFNILSSTVRNAMVLDLYSGTGALGLEAISRGARHAVMVDIAPESLSLIRRNVDRCNQQDACTVIRWDAATNLNCLKSQSDRFNLVLMDPPYYGELVPLTLKHLSKSDCLAPGATIIAEHEPFDGTPQGPSPFTFIDQRRYGQTFITFYQFLPN